LEELSMHVGVVLPQTEIGTDAASVRDYAQAAQDLGFEHIVTSDHVLGADPAGHPGWSRPQVHTTVVHEPFVLLGFISGIAPKLGLLTSVVILPQRQTALVAKQAAEVDVLSDGKLRLGVGIGWNPVEFEGLNENFKNRARRFEEQFDLMRKLWTEQSLSYNGEHHTITSAGISPLPIQRPIPLWVGASAEAAVKRATRIADGYLPLAPIIGTSGFEETMEKVRGWLQEAGRDPASFGVEARLNATTGTPDDWRKTVEQWRGLGATHLSVGTGGAGLSGVDAHIGRLREARQVLDQ
jgi:probable F420-dependent oxidoreductase